jgi:hypothetical protein
MCIITQKKKKKQKRKPWTKSIIICVFSRDSPRKFFCWKNPILKIKKLNWHFFYLEWIPILKSPVWIWNVDWTFLSPDIVINFTWIISNSKRVYAEKEQIPQLSEKNNRVLLLYERNEQIQSSSQKWINQIDWFLSLLSFIFSLFRIHWEALIFNPKTEIKIT